MMNCSLLNCLIRKRTHNSVEYTDDLLVLLAIVTAPVSLPILGIGYIGYKIYDKINSSKESHKIKQIKNKFEQIGYKISTTNHTLRYFINNTNIVLIDENKACDYTIIYQIESLWLLNNNFIFIVVDLDNIPYDFILTVDKYISKYDENRITIYNKNNKINLLNNYMIKLPNYYGLLCKKFKCDIITIHEDIELQEMCNKIID